MACAWLSLPISTIKISEVFKISKAGPLELETSDSGFDNFNQKLLSSNSNIENSVNALIIIKK